jgi:hypothetical protein
VADYPPFMNSYGLIPKILSKIKEAKTPPRFTVDFFGTSLGYTSGSARPFIAFAKRLGFLSSDGVPTEIYAKFRDPNHSKTAMAKAMRHGYAQLYERNEYAHQLDKKGLEGLIIQATGLDKGSGTVKSIARSFLALAALADFQSPEEISPEPTKQVQKAVEVNLGEEPQGLKMNPSYTINLNLPKTDDIAVFNAIFKALRENLLKR